MALAGTRSSARRREVQKKDRLQLEDTVWPSFSPLPANPNGTAMLTRRERSGLPNHETSFAEDGALYGLAVRPEHHGDVWVVAPGGVYQRRLEAGIPVRDDGRPTAYCPAQRPPGCHIDIGHRRGPSSRRYDIAQGLQCRLLVHGSTRVFSARTDSNIYAGLGWSPRQPIRALAVSEGIDTAVLRVHRRPRPSQLANGVTSRLPGELVI